MKTFLQNITFSLDIEKSINRQKFVFSNLERCYSKKKENSTSTYNQFSNVLIC